MAIPGIVIVEIYYPLQIFSRIPIFVWFVFRCLVTEGTFVRPRAHLTAKEKMTSEVNIGTPEGTGSKLAVKPHEKISIRLKLIGRRHNCY